MSELVGKIIQVVRQDRNSDGDYEDGPITLYFTDGTSVRITGVALFSGDAALDVEYRDSWGEAAMSPKLSPKSPSA